jgi:hypothetical protein
MGTLIFVCPTTGHQVSTGIEVDRSSYKRLPRTKTAIFCPRCHKNHLLSRIWAWLDSNDPKVVVTDAVPLGCPYRSELTLAGRRSARAGLADKKSEVDETKAVIRY